MKINIPRQKSSGAAGGKGLHPALYVGRLMAPAQVKAATASYSEVLQNKVAGHWTLCGDVQTEMFVRLPVGDCYDMQERFTSFSTPAGGSYAVLSQQCQGFQHRFLLPLFEPQVGAFLASMAQSALVISLANNDGVEAVVWRSRIGAPELLARQAFTTPLSPAVREPVVVEFFRVVREMSELAKLPSAIPDEVVHHVSLTILMPEETLRQCDKRLLQGLV